METSNTLPSWGRISFSSDFRKNFLSILLFKCYEGINPLTVWTSGWWYPSSITNSLLHSGLQCPRKCKNQPSSGAGAQLWTPGGTKGILAHKCVTCTFQNGCLCPCSPWQPELHTHLWGGTCFQEIVQKGEWIWSPCQVEQGIMGLNYSQGNPDIKINFLTTRVVKLQER